MNKLVSANFMHLKKDKIFWIAAISMFIAGTAFPLIKYMDMKQSGYINNLDNGFFACALLVGIVIAVFCSLFIGTEHSDGTIRNKIIVGQNRIGIYLSDLITCAIVAIIICCAFFIPFLGIGIPLLGFFVTDVKVILLIGLAVIVLSITFSSIFTLIALLCTNKAIISVVCILLAFGLLFTGAMLDKMLDAPETILSYSIGESGEPAAKEVKNPKYLEGTQREIVQFLYDVVPGGQAVQCAKMEIVNLPMLPVYSLIIILATTGIGLFFFRKKDLK
jgi:ABC-2 type transport system permease protein